MHQSNRTDLLEKHFCHQRAAFLRFNPKSEETCMNKLSAGFVVLQIPDTIKTLSRTDLPLEFEKNAVTGVRSIPNHTSGGMNS